MKQIGAEQSHINDPSAHSWRGVDSELLANALVRYAQEHPDGGVPREVRLATSANALQGEGNEWALGRYAWSGFGLRAALRVPANADGSYTIDGTIFQNAPFSRESRSLGKVW